MKLPISSNIIITGDNQDLPESLINLIDQINEGNDGKNSSDIGAFEEANPNQHFQTVSPGALDNLASETNAISTHWTNKLGC